MHVRSIVFAAALLVAGAASAQSPGRPGEFYFDQDPNTTREIVAVRGSGNELADELLKRMERSARAKAEVAQLAHIAMEAGRHDLGRDLYRRALGRIGQLDALWRPLLWNYGWDLYRAGDAAGALQQWSTLVNARITSASWIPPTLALALWSAGQKEEAVQWYAAAVRTEPQQWNSPANFERLLPDWRPEERATLAEVQAAWAANPPVWP